MQQVRLVSIVGWLACVACASGAEHNKPDDGLDDLRDPTSERDGSSGSQSSTSPKGDAATDAAVESATSGDTSSIDAGQSSQTSSPNPFHDVDARVSDEPDLDAGSLIIDPDVVTYDPLTLCSSVWQLQGQVIATNLAGYVLQGEWASVRDFSMVFDGGIGDSLDVGTDSGAPDGQACGDRFAPYLIACEQGAIVLQSPSRVYASGPVVGNEPVTVGCWERNCAVDCIPSSVESLAGVRALLSPVLPSAVPDGSAPATTGFVRMNGVDVEAIATLEIVGRLE